MDKRGWRKEPARHSLSARGVKTRVPRKSRSYKGGRSINNRVKPLETYEREGGACPYCGEPAKWRVCAECGKGAWIIDCGHYDQPRPISAGRVDGSDSAHYYCDECARLKEK